MTIHGVGVTHVDSFISKRLCEQAGIKVENVIKDVKTQYVCALEIN